MKLGQRAAQHDHAVIRPARERRDGAHARSRRIAAPKAPGSRLPTAGKAQAAREGSGSVHAAHRFAIVSGGRIAAISSMRARRSLMIIWLEIADVRHQYMHFVLTKSVNRSISKSLNRSRPNNPSHFSCAL